MPLPPLSHLRPLLSVLLPDDEDGPLVVLAGVDGDVVTLALQEQGAPEVKLIVQADVVGEILSAFLPVPVAAELVSVPDAPALDVEEVRRRLRAQLDAFAPAVTVPDDVDLFDEDDELAVRLARDIHERAATATALLQGALLALDAAGHGSSLGGVSALCQVGRAEFWITRTPDATPTETATAEVAP